MSLWVVCGLLVFLLAFTLLEDEARVQVRVSFFKYLSLSFSRAKTLK